MMPVIRISDEVFGRLQQHATPFVDTPASVIERLLDAFEATQSHSPQSHPDRPSNATDSGSQSGEQVARGGQLDGPTIHKHGTRYTVEGYGGLCEFLRGLGNAGWSWNDAQRLLARCPGGKSVAQATLQKQVRIGRQWRDGHRSEEQDASEPLHLNDQQLSALNALIVGE